MKHTIKHLSLFILTLICLTSCYEERAASKPQAAITEINLTKYVGRWHEISRFDMWFQRGCVAVTADYKIIAADKISVVNSCRMKTIDGELKQAEGVARVPDPAKPAELKVRFNKFGANLFEGDYWVIALDPKYKWAVVSDGAGESLWVLSRTPQMSDKIYNRIIADLKSKGLKTEFLIKTEQVK